jgi:hypothetical protein
MTCHRAGLLALLTTAALAGAGCSDPYADSTATQTPPTPARTTPRAEADRQADHGDPETPRTPSALAGPDAERVAAHYARAAGNWSWKTYRRQYAQLRALAAGELARQLAATPPDRDVLRGLADQRQTNRAGVLAVDSRPARDGTRHVIVVLAEITGARGTRDVVARHNVYRAIVHPTDRGWKVTAWQLLP